MVSIGKRLYKIRKAKNMTQGDVLKPTKFTISHISRVENGHTMPSLETLERWADAFNMPFHDLLYCIAYNPYDKRLMDSNIPIARTVPQELAEFAETITQEGNEQSNELPPQSSDEEVTQPGNDVHNQLTC